MTRTKAVGILRDFIHNNADNEGREEDTGEGPMDVLDWLDAELRREKPLLIHIDRDGESLCGMELHHGTVPLTTERGDVTCIGCWILRDEEA